MKIVTRAGKKPRSPLFTVSGIYSCAVETIRALAQRCPALGGVTTKSIGLAPRPGYPEPVLAGYLKGSYSNAVGLANPGADTFRRELESILPLPEDVFLLVSIFADGSLGNFCRELAILAQKLGPLADGLELNLSCPHVKAAGAAIGKNPEDVEAAVAAVRERTDLPVFAKLSQNFGNIGVLAAAAERAGATGISAINTVGPGLVCEPASGMPILSHRLGGISGAAIYPLGLAAVQKIRTACALPILGMGGIRAASHLRAYRQAGAELFGVGSALAGMGMDRVDRYTKSLLEDLADGGDRATSLLVDPPMRYRPMTVASIDRYDKDLLVLQAAEEVEAEPGQFAMVLLSGEPPREKPMSYAGSGKFTMAARRTRSPDGSPGPFSDRLFGLEVGSSFWLRGPYGLGLELRGGSFDFVSGGTGAAPLRFAVQRLGGETPVRFFLGAKKKNELLFCSELSGSDSLRLFPSTDDGSGGFRGTVVDRYADFLRSAEPAETVVCCGPEKMMRALVEALRSKVDLARLFLISEPYMKCGVGICGTCSLSDGRLSCVDGHILSAAEAIGFAHFGHKRDATAAWRSS